jgi:hypothetical protein
MYSLPSTAARPPIVGTWATIAFAVLTCQIRTIVSVPVAATRRSSIANGPTAAARFPHEPRQSTWGRSTITWAKR